MSDYKVITKEVELHKNYLKERGPNPTFMYVGMLKTYIFQVWCSMEPKPRNVYSYQKTGGGPITPKDFRLPYEDVEKNITRESEGVSSYEDVSIKMELLQAAGMRYPKLVFALPKNTSLYMKSKEGWDEITTTLTS